MLKTMPPARRPAQEKPPSPCPTTIAFHIGVALALVYVIWGSTYLAIRYAVETIPAFLLAAIRFFVAGVAMYAWLRLRGAPNPSWRQWRSATLIGLLLLVGGNAT